LLRHFLVAIAELIKFFRERETGHCLNPFAALLQLAHGRVEVVSGNSSRSPRIRPLKEAILMEG
jgi:hypothetical protein